ncbi:MAG: hypothetical protein K0S65_2158, partial [Labilithrix sp.]|nr:hypothetical protein [Labilithrix sp.]
MIQPPRRPPLPLPAVVALEPPADFPDRLARLGVTLDA